MNRHLLAIALLLAVAACKVGGGTEQFPVADNCSPIGNACADHADCCSFGCEFGICARNPDEGGACRTSDDCDWTMTCVGGACAVGATCRNDTDVCTYDNACCSGNCAGLPSSGTCAPNHPPTVGLGLDRSTPYYRTTALSGTVADQDGDTLVYGWTLVSAPPGYGLGAWTSNLASPSVFLDVPGPWVFRLVVTDGPASQRNRLTAQDEVTLTAVNEPPLVDAGADIASQLRNVAVSISGTVSDPNGTASPVSCTWYATPPGGAETSVATQASCPPSPAYLFTPPIEGPEGDWTFRLEASDGALTASDTRIVRVVNGAPTANAGPDRVGNLGPPGQAAPAIPLLGTATDPNLDTVTFEWTVSAVSAPGSAWTAGELVGSAAAAGFVPDAMGTYTLQLRVDDGWGGIHDDLVTVTAERHLRPLLGLDGSSLPRGEIADAAYLKASEKIVLIGTDRSGASPVYRLWVLDPASQAAPVAVTLGAEPVCLAISPDQTEALVGELGSKWQRVTGLGATPGASLVFNGPFTPNDLVHAGTRWYAVGAAGTVYELFDNGTVLQAPCQNCGTVSAPEPLRGTRAVGRLDKIWLVDETGDTLSRYDVRPNGNLERAPAGLVTGLAGVDRLWLSQDDQDVILGDGSIFVASTLSPDGTALPFAPLHFDSSVVSTVLQGLAFPAPGSTLTRLSASYASTGTLPIPQLGVAGTGYAAAAQLGFVRADGTAHYAVVRATVSGADRYYLAGY
jgi:hypothetical protein